VSRLSRHTREPGGDVGVARHVEAAFRRAMRVAVERDVGDGVTPAREPVMRLQMGLHDGQRGVAFLVPFADEMALLVEFSFRRIGEPEACHRDVGLVAVLFEEHPLMRLGAAPAFRGHQLGVLGKVPQDRAGLRQDAAVVEFEHGNATVGILREELCRTRRAVVQAVFLQRQWDVELARAEPYFVAIAGYVHLVKR